MLKYYINNYLIIKIVSVFRAFNKQTIYINSFNTFGLSFIRSTYIRSIES